MKSTKQKEVKKLLQRLNKKGIPTLERHQFPKEVKWDSSAMYAVWNPEINGYAYVTSTSHSVANFFNNIIEKWGVKVYDVPLSVRGFQTYTVPIEWDVEETMAYHYCPDKLILVSGDGYEMNLFPYHDGVMVQAIVVDDSKRGQGIGTDVMNKLYDLSADLGVPLYLVPFPAGKNDASKIHESVERLQKWYSGLDFGPVDGHPTIWSNY